MLGQGNQQLIQLELQFAVHWKMHYNVHYKKYFHHERCLLPDLCTSHACISAASFLTSHRKGQLLPLQVSTLITFSHSCIYHPRLNSVLTSVREDQQVFVCLLVHIRGIAENQNRAQELWVPWQNSPTFHCHLTSVPAFRLCLMDALANASHLQVSFECLQISYHHGIYRF